MGISELYAGFAVATANTLDCKLQVDDVVDNLPGQTLLSKHSGQSHAKVESNLGTA
jgi:hypothetical protein